MRLTPAEFGELQEALQDAYLSYDDLAPTVRRAGWRIQDVTGPGPMPQVSLAVIEFAESRDRVQDLLAAARVSNPTNVRLLKLSAAIGLEPGAPPPGQDPEQALAEASQNLERLVTSQRGIADLGSYAAKIQELVGQVCAIEAGNEWGTGFLIGPDTVLTNHHVVAAAIGGALKPSAIKLRFDYRHLRDGLTTNAGVVHDLADKWLVHATPHSAVDTRAYDKTKMPDPAELDYAVLRTRVKVGEERSSKPYELKRGWIVPRAQAYEFPPDTFLLAVQHPCRQPISLDFADNAVIRVNANRTRVQYRINTLGGSSGSPVLDRDLDLVALHHAGEPGSPDHGLPCQKQTTVASYNEGIPIATIQAHLDAVGHGDVFGSAPA